MVGHTGYLVFARPVLVGDENQSQELLEEAGITFLNNGDENDLHGYE